MIAMVFLLIAAFKLGVIFGRAKGLVEASLNPNSTNKEKAKSKENIEEADYEEI